MIVSLEGKRLGFLMCATVGPKVLSIFFLYFPLWLQCLKLYRAPSFPLQRSPPVTFLQYFKRYNNPYNSRYRLLKVYQAFYKNYSTRRKRGQLCHGPISFVCISLWSLNVSNVSSFCFACLQNTKGNDTRTTVIASNSLG